MSEALGAGAASKAKLVRVPGIASFADTSATGFRGFFETSDVIYVAHEDTLKTITSAGVVATFGTLSGTEFVSFAANNKAPVSDKVVITENGAFKIDTTTTTISSYDDPELPQATDVCFGDGYFFFAIADSKCYATEINGTNVAALDFASAEGMQDELMRCVFYSGQLYLAGPGSIEVWDGSSPNATGFPFNRVTVIQRGIISKTAITGYEKGFGLSICFTGENGIVYALKGYEPNRISSPDVERDIAAVSDKSTIRMTSFVNRGHPCIVVRSADWCWVFDLSTQTWHERKSYLSDTWRGLDCLWAFDKWLIADDDTGKIGQLSDSTYTEFGDTMVYEVESCPAQAFPQRMAVSRADFHFVTGVGLVTGTDTQVNPQVGISWSDNGGESWGSPLMRALGRIGRNDTQVTVNRTGSTGQKGRRWKLQVSDPVPVSLLGGDMQTEARAA